uniref:CCT-theta n=1 Tax=Eucampia antarctica TaxID=49252 RepID=A0A7S2S188_9STRA|mmetsp:Transcript_29538/g.28406  ORF Transcript_29538/g.28406 Transcript_29538/m.28406 type:complete len:546 (+) Transcript_29538:32-1669(+)|eukprot:CAMPEP_0197831270 /NCGR_PEP_ID=MMETSP1437-20131217/8818_1 /TAXON_ID=49252 ORGANISM="Eucampia antarctica, Strain CCMP1452" /NCGR_SAMPLE_ID=MMETSP1437 /ASSEMBLY_ACC=CAM_ASM_001096 /LENGTH=545 /DNA_ID=CAMNT_0043434125 /DNA_START=32 /DNA_END=1669 /DNA_ORIENTATION=+
MARSMSLNQASGLQGMLKSGHTHIDEGAAFRNIDASKELSNIVASSLGPNGMSKLVVNHLGRIIVTSDCATIVKELEIEHPAAKMLEMASSMQDSECGDGTNLTVSFAGELLTLTQDLLRSGLHTSEVVAGYRKASEKMLQLLPTLTVKTVENLNKEESYADLMEVLIPVLAAKQYGSETILAPLVAEACRAIMPPDQRKASVSPESVRIVKILGGSISQSRVIYGYVAPRGVDTSITKVLNAKITVFGCGLEASATEAKGTVLMNNAHDLKTYNKSEEEKMEEIIKAVADSGTNVVVSGGTVSEMALHFLERYKIMCLKVNSKWELRRLCAATGSTALVRLGPATPDEIGACSSVQVQEVGDKHITIFSHDNSGSGNLSTILLRASTSSTLQDMERAIDDGVHAAKMACKDGRLVPGAGATEMELAVKIRNYADSCPGLEQYAIRSFAKALECVPRTLAENAGLNSGAVLASLSAAHANGNTSAGVNIEACGVEAAEGVNLQTDVLDLLATKESAFKLAVDAALTILKVDQIIMAKKAGAGPPK